jgi:hypothetical protein
MRGMRKTLYICDACYYRGKPDVKATKRHGFIRGVKYDLCDAHWKEIKALPHQSLETLAEFVYNRQVPLKPEKN